MNNKNTSKQKARLKELLQAAQPMKGKRGRKDVLLQTSKEGKGKFGRILGSLWVNGENVNSVLMAEGHAREYFGGSKNALGPWTKQIFEADPYNPDSDYGWFRWTPNGYVPYLKER